MDRIRILIVDDHAFFRRSITPPLEEEPTIEIVGFAEDGDEAVRCSRMAYPDVILMDLRMPYLSGLDAIQRIAPQKKAPAILIITGSDDRAYVVKAFAMGASGYLRKDNISDEMLISAIFTVASGGVFVDPDVFTDLLPSLIASEAHPDPDPTLLRILSAEDILLLQQVALGHENTMIAEVLRITPKTVSNRLGLLYTELGVSNRVQAATFALRNGLVSLVETQ